MFSLLHNFEPTPIILSIGFIKIYWYGLFMIIAILSGLFVSFKIGKYHNLKEKTILDLAFYLIIFGIIGARIYDVFLELPYYLKDPTAIFRIWQGGLAIHGGLLGGAIGLYYFTKKNNSSLIKLGAIIAPGLALGQAIGRWGNYFNQELFGLPTTLPWGIPINIINRPELYITNTYFHPTFLYEFTGNLVIFGILLYLNLTIIKQINKKSSQESIFKDQELKKEAIDLKFVILAYLFLYSLLRLSLELVRIDYTPTLFGIRWPQIISIIIISSIIYYKVKNKE
ncbi:prolipoprotein diacylglyceryl transferase [Patescibacteria group bacterium]|nr:prolipoprotein diacylglyceryl transferase [Patescibacteria group bacterium]